MYKLFIILVFFLVTPASYSAEFKNPNIENSVFRVSAPTGYATAFYIGNGLFVTNAHIVFTSAQVKQSKPYNERSFEELLEEAPLLKEDISKNFKIYLNLLKVYFPVTSIIALDIANDLAVLKVSDNIMSFIDGLEPPNRLVPLKLGSLPEDLKNKKGYMYGFPVLRPYFNIKRINLKEVILKNMSSSEPESLRAFANENHFNGASGSPILVDGQVVGVMKINLNNAISTISSDTLKTLLENPLPKPLTKMHEIAEKFIYLKEQAKKDWKVLAELQLLEAAFASDSEYKKKYILKTIKNLEEILKHYPNISSAEQLQDYYYVMKKHKEILDLGEKFPYPTLLHENGEVHLKRGDLDKALESFHKAAKQNYSSSFYVLALYYHVQGDMLKFERYMKRAALRGYFQAQVALDGHYKNKEGYSGKLFSKYNKDKPLHTIKKGSYPFPNFYIDRFKKLLKKEESKRRGIKGLCYRVFKQ